MTDRWFVRLGLAIARPREALTIAGDRRHAGRSGTDLILLMLVMLVATQLRAFVGAFWLGKVVDAGLGLRAAMQVLTRSLTVDLAFLVLGALVLFAIAGRKRSLGRAFDLACVAAVPLLVVELVATTTTRLFDVELVATTTMRLFDVQVPIPVGWMLSAISWGWAGALLALAWRVLHHRQPAPVASGRTTKPVRIAGWTIVGIVLVGTTFQAVWIVRNLDAMRPVSLGESAPTFALPVVGPDGALGPPYTLKPGRPTVIDFWATWCKPCVAAMPQLDRIARDPDVDVITINLDDAKAARALFDRAGYQLVLLEDDGKVSERYGVTSIPHTVMIDASGQVRRVTRGGTTRLEAFVEEIRK